MVLVDVATQIAKGLPVNQDLRFREVQAGPPKAFYARFPTVLMERLYEDGQVHSFMIHYRNG